MSRHNLSSTGPLKSLIEFTALNPVGWFAYRVANRLSVYLSQAHEWAKESRRNAGKPEPKDALEISLEQLFQQPAVSSGPFQGLRYPSTRAIGSAIWPKLLGLYESELHPVIEELLANRYTSIIDIGCAEGYYAIGLALRSPEAQIYAYDTNARAKELCAQMADLNGVHNRLHLGDFCTRDVLKSIPLGHRALVVSDCEGYEGQLFDKAIAEHLKGHDVIIETHDFIDIELSNRIREAFAETHHIRSIKSTDDIEKGHTYRSPLLERYTTRERFVILREARPFIMEWLIMTSK